MSINDNDGNGSVGLNIPVTESSTPSTSQEPTRAHDHFHFAAKRTEDVRRRRLFAGEDRFRIRQFAKGAVPIRDVELIHMSASAHADLVLRSLDIGRGKLVDQAGAKLARLQRRGPQASVVALQREV